MQLNKLILSLIFLLCSSLFISGCGLLFGSSDSPYTVSFVKGELNSKVDRDLESTWQATQDLAAESQFNVKSARADVFSAVLKCDDAQQRKIEIILEKEEPKTTRVRIRVGLLGDAELSGKIFDQLRKKLN